MERASLRLAINLDATCPGLPPEGSQDIASIVYEDGDSTVTEHAPGQMLMICGQSALSDPTEYASCVGQFNCCDNFSTGATSGCTCGEALCLQSKWGTESFFTGPDCSGIEYSDGANGTYQSWDGLGTVGTSTATVSLQSARDASGACLALTHLDTNGVCNEYYPITKSMSGMRRVYRPYISTYAADPQGSSDWPGRVVRVTTYTGHCR